jgi:hypothetical protein
MIHRRAVVLVASHTAILVLGMAVGAWIALDRTARGNALLEETGSIERMTSYVRAQRTLGDTGAYEAALNDLLLALERHRAKPGLILDESVIAADIALTHTRLALLAEGRGDTTVAEQHLDEALAKCPTKFLKSCSVDDLRRMVLEIDTTTSVPRVDTK